MSIIRKLCISDFNLHLQLPYVHSEIHFILVFYVNLCSVCDWKIWICIGWSIISPDTGFICSKKGRGWGQFVQSSEWWVGFFFFLQLFLREVPECKSDPCQGFWAVSWWSKLDFQFFHLFVLSVSAATVSCLLCVSRVHLFIFLKIIGYCGFSRFLCMTMSASILKIEGNRVFTQIWGHVFWEHVHIQLTGLSNFCVWKR